MYLYITDWTIFAGFQVANNAHFTKGVKTFDDGGCVYEVSSTQDAHEMRVELSNLYPGRPMHVEREKEQQSVGGLQSGLGLDSYLDNESWRRRSAENE